MQPFLLPFLRFTRFAFSTFSALTPLVGHQQRHSACDEQPISEHFPTELGLSCADHGQLAKKKKC